MKNYTKINDCCVLVQEDGKEPCIVNIEQREKTLNRFREQTNIFTQKLTELQNEITEIQNEITEIQSVLIRTAPK